MAYNNGARNQGGQRDSYGYNHYQNSAPRVITPKDLPEDFVDVAEKHMNQCYRSITTSKIRNMLSLVIDCYQAESRRTDENITPESADALTNMRIRVVYEMGRDDNGKTLKVKVGDVIRIKLKSNRTTGYSWALVSGKTDAKVLKAGEIEYAVDEHPAGMVGVGGNDFCTFTALAPGKTDISLGYARPWEKDKEPAQTFKLTVEVEGAAAPAAGAKADAKAAAPAKAEVRLNDKDNGKTVKVAVDGTVILSLESNATTGFSWTKADKVDKDILKLEKNDYMQSPNPNGLLGVGGTTVIVYRALKKGKAKIDLTYMQPWNPDSEFNTNYSVTVEVE